MNTLADVLNGKPRDSCAVIIPDGGLEISYGNLQLEVERLATVLTGYGLEHGRSVSIILPNSFEFITLFLSVITAGAVAAPLNPAYAAEEFEFYIKDSDSQLVVVPPGPHLGRDAASKLGVPIIECSLNKNELNLSTSHGLLSTLRDPKLPVRDDVALFLHTSGTTNRPKGVPLRHSNLIASIGNISNTYKLSPEDIAMVVMPLFHVHGLIGVLLSTFFSGGTVVVPDRFSAGKFWPIQKETRATWYSAVPTIHQVLLMRAESDMAPDKSFRFIRSCSSALAPSVFEDLEERFGAPVLEAYGMTEASHQMTSSPLPEHGKRYSGTVGRPTGVDVSVMSMNTIGKMMATDQRGEIVIRGPNVMYGYNNNPQANKESFVDGWFRTGDQGFIDKSGYLSLTGRIKELINRGGEKISPLEIDGVLLKHPAVSEAVCFGIPDEKYGEVVHAAVVLTAEADEQTLRNFCGDHLGAFKVPDVIYITDTLPRTATGKIQRRHVASKFKR